MSPSPRVAGLRPPTRTRRAVSSPFLCRCPPLPRSPFVRPSARPPPGPSVPLFVLFLSPFLSRSLAPFYPPSVRPSALHTSLPPSLPRSSLTPLPQSLARSLARSLAPPTSRSLLRSLGRPPSLPCAPLARSLWRKPRLSPSYPHLNYPYAEKRQDLQHRRTFWIRPSNRRKFGDGSPPTDRFRCCASYTSWRASPSKTNPTLSLPGPPSLVGLQGLSLCGQIRDPRFPPYHKPTVTAPDNPPPLPKFKISLPTPPALISRPLLSSPGACRG